MVAFPLLLVFTPDNASHSRPTNWLIWKWYWSSQQILRHLSMLAWLVLNPNYNASKPAAQVPFPLCCVRHEGVINPFFGECNIPVQSTFCYVFVCFSTQIRVPFFSCLRITYLLPQQCCQVDNLAISYCSFKNILFYQKLSYICEKVRKGPKTTQWQNYVLCTILMQQPRGAVLWTRPQHSQLHPVTQSLLWLLPFDTKAPYLHMLSVFYHRELNSLREKAKLSYIQPFFLNFWSYIVQRAKLSYKYDRYRTSGNTVP